MNVNLSMRFTLLVVGAIVLAADPGLATLPAPVRIDAGLVSGVAGGTATMRVFKGIHLRRRLWVRCDGGRRSPLGVGLAFGWRTSSAHGACNRAGGWWAARRTSAALPMSEDCLYLNVDGAASASERRPVILWSHGGALTVGTDRGSMARRWLERAR